MTYQEIDNKFKFMIYEKDSADFEKFVLEIYRLYYPNIQDVKPQGQKGDGGNDGYVVDELVIQCYAPEKIDSAKTIQKIDNDLSRALQSGWKFKEWNFVVNDKFKGIPREIHHKIDELNEKYPNIEIKLVDSKILQGKLLEKIPEKHYQIYILLDYEKNIINFNDLESMICAINFIAEDSIVRSFNQIQAFKNFALEKLNPNGQEKLKINNIKDESFLKIFSAYLEKSKEIIEEYKDKIDNFSEVGGIIKDKFKRFNKSYQVEASLQKTFDYFIKRNEKCEQNFQLALWIVIAYFFDICDIGDLP